VVCVCIDRDDDFERTKKMDFKGEYHGMKEEPVVSTMSRSVCVSSCLSVDLYVHMSICQYFSGEYHSTVVTTF